MANEVKELEKQLQEARKREKEAHRQEKKEQKEAKRNVRRREKEELKSRKQQLLEEKEIRREILQEETGGKPDKSKKKKKRREEDPIQKEEHDFLPYTWASLYLPIRKIKNGIIYTADRRYVKIVEILPINFLLRSPAEQRNIISSFLSYLKIAPVRMQFKVISRKADIAEYLKKIQREMEQEEDEQCRILQEDYMRLIRTVGTKEAITRRFFLIFEYSSYNRNKNPTDQEVYLYMKTAVQTARKYLSMCGNAVLTHENETRFSVDILYQMLNRRTSVLKPLSDKIQEVKQWYMRENGEDSLSHIPVAELIAPREIDFRHRNYIVMDGVYHTYLFIPSGKYRSKVPAG